MLGADLYTILSKQFLVTPITKENYKKNIGTSFNVVINANGNSKRFWANQHPLEDFTLSTESVYKSIFDFSSNLYIYISSSDVYENHSSPLTTKEKKNIETTQLSSYGLHKYFSELLVKKYATNFIILRCSLMLGKQLRKGPIFDILQKNPLFITKDSNLQMITAEEVGNAITILLKMKITNETFNIGGKGVVSFKNIEKIVRIPVTFSQDANKQTYQMNVSKLDKIFQLKKSKEYLQDFINTLQSNIN